MINKARKLLTWLACHNVLVEPRDGRLHVEGSRSILTEEVFKIIGEMKRELIEEIDNNGPGWADIIPGLVDDWPACLQEAFLRDREYWMQVIPDNHEAGKLAEIHVRAHQYRVYHPELSMDEIKAGMRAGTIPPKDHPLCAARKDHRHENREPIS